ncbi:MAG: hypothetical protein ABSA94_10595 [Acidobacteriaceae bacterium]|jgi:hypothetical protein
MKSGLDNKRNVIVLAVLGVLMVGALVYFAKSMFGGGSPAPAPVQQTTTARTEPAAARQAGSRNEGGRAAEKLPPLEKLDPTLHPELMAGAEALEYSGTGRNIFSLVSEPPKIEQVKGPIRPQPVVPQPQIAQGPPPPPPIDLKFFGYEAAGGARKAFLLHGDDVFIAVEGDVVDHHYKVLKITPLSIQVTDLLYNNTQTLALTQS